MLEIESCVILRMGTLIGSSLIVVGGLLFILSSPLLAILTNRNAGTGSSMVGNYDWRLWPILLANSFFVKFFGERGIGIRGLFSWKCIFMTALLSASANIICVIIILNYIPTEGPLFDLYQIKILGLSHLWFIIFNFFGDLTSVCITRHLLDKMARNRAVCIRYIAYDTLGILMGYLITASPSIVATIYAAHSEIYLNQLISKGMLGCIIIPFFLLVFATGGMPFVFAIFALIAVFSVTIPTAIYIFLFTFLNLSFILKRFVFQGRDFLNMRLLRFLRDSGNYIVMLGGTIIASVTLYCWILT